MKRVVSVSLGSSQRDHRVELEMLGQRVLIERIGCDGDEVRARQLYRELDGQVDALGVGGMDLGLRVYDKVYPLHAPRRIVQDVRKTPLVDGDGVRRIVERQVMQWVEAEIGDELYPKRALITTAVDRFDMALSFHDAGYDAVYGDFMFSLGLPIPIKGLRTLRILAALLLPVLGRLPFSMLYPTGEKQDVIVPKWGRWYGWATVIAGDFNYIRRHMPERLDGKSIVTNTTTPEDVELLRRRGVKYLITSTPRLGGRTFGTNVMEALLVALAGKGRPLSHEELLEMMQQVDIRPTIQRLAAAPKTSP
ncbi:MAG: quinate 5-dehydrogenase [Anaerolineae bacterium]|nr:quinate 5-dehydrogenase [Anaerolineae bacterium]